MVLQRWQTVWLLVAIGAMIVFLLNPIVGGANSELPDMTWIAVAGWVDVALAAAAVVTYRKIKVQMMLAALCGVVSLAIGLVVIYIGLSVGQEWHWTAFLPFVASVMAWLGYFGIRHDKKILESADRLWD